MDKKAIIKGLAYIALIILLCTIISRFFINSGETLAEYAQKNPELAYPTIEETNIEEDAPDD